MSDKLHRLNSRAPRFLSGLVVVMTALAMLDLPGRAENVHVQDATVPGPRTTLVVFADHPLREDAWPALFAALHSGLAGLAPETQAIDANPELIRGDAVKPGLEVDASVSVYLHGECTLMPQLRRYFFVVGPLGWVRRQRGRIEPFVHVDCTLIGEMLAPAVLGMNREQRTSAMSGAIARVILHEWIHVATQSPEHGRHGITKAQFTVDDLISGDNQPVAHLHRPHSPITER